MKRIALAAVVLIGLSLQTGCKKAKGKRRGYDDDRQIGTGTDIVDGAIGGPLRAGRQARIQMTVFSINQLIQIETIERAKPKDLDEVKALWEKEMRKPWPEPVFRYKYVYDARAGRVSQVHKTPDEYTPEERKAEGRRDR